MKRSALIYWLILVLVATSFTGYIFYIDDRGYPKSDDSFAWTATMFTFFSTFFGVVIYACTFWVLRLFRRSPAQR